MPDKKKVTYSITDDHSLVVHATGELIIDDEARDEARELVKQLEGVELAEDDFEPFTDSKSNNDLSGYPGAGGSAAPIRVPFLRIKGVRDPVLLARQLVARGHKAQPNHLHSAHLRSSASLRAGPAYATFYAGPAYATPAYATPAYATPAYATPAYATPAYATPAYATPAASPAARTDAIELTTSAVPAAEGLTTDAIFDRLKDQKRNNDAYVFVLDTGLIKEEYVSDALRPLLKGSQSIRPLGQKDAEDKPGDPMPFAAGHGTFIATLISQIAPGCRVAVAEVLDNSGVGDEWTIAQRISELTTSLRALAANGGTVAAQSVLNLSFGATALDNRPFLLAQVILNIQSIGVVVVASAGDDAKTKEVFPAALPGVVGVGALGPTGPAPFTNSGAWVTACAPGVELISAFFGGLAPKKGAAVPKLISGVGDFKGWAIWSGTSFSAPVVAGALARQMMAQTALDGKKANSAGKRPTTAHDAKKRLIDPPWLMRVPNLGTVVNVV